MRSPSTRTSLALAVLLGTAAGFCAPATAQTVRDLTVVQSQAFEAAKPASGSLTVITLLDRLDATYAVGEDVRLGVKTNEDAFVTVLNIGASGEVTQLFPNSFQPDNSVKAGEVLEIPSKSSGAKITVAEPVGAELIKVIATSAPYELIPDNHFEGSGTFKSLQGKVEGLVRDLSVVSERPPADTSVAIVDQIIKTVPSRIATATTGTPTVAGGVLVIPLAPAQ